MGLKIYKICLLISLIFLQSCSGSRIGNFLESSFKNVEESQIKEDTKNNLKNKTSINPEVNGEENKNIKEILLEEDTNNNLKNKTIINSEENSKKNKKITEENLSLKKRQYQPQSYKIIFILKDVDPKDPIEDLSVILRNSDVNFEIEKIERFVDSKNKSVDRD